MRIREVYENCLIELNKVQAPSLLLGDFVYFFNKAIQQYFNKRYNLFEINQQLTDDLRVLSKTKKLIPVRTDSSTRDVFGVSFKCDLPEDYVHILNCICEFEELNPKNKCNDVCHTFQYGANKLDTNQWSSVITNYYMRPSVKQPYYYIINIDEPADVNLSVDSITGEKIKGIRYGNTKLPIMEIKCGNLDPSKYNLKAVYIDYLRAPQYIDLDAIEDLDDVYDDTKQLEFPDYVIYEIINELVTLIMENGKDQRTQTFIPVNTTIPAQK